MALFCPTCHNMLLLRREAQMEFYCRTCPYIYALKQKVSRKTVLTPKKIDEPISDNLQETGAKIPGAFKCSFSSFLVFLLSSFLYAIASYIPFQSVYLEFTLVLHRMRCISKRDLAVCFGCMCSCLPQLQPHRGLLLSNSDSFF